MNFARSFSEYNWLLFKEPARGGNFTMMGVGVCREIESIFCRDDGEETASIAYCKLPAYNTYIISVHFPMGRAERFSHVRQLAKEQLKSESYPSLIVGGDFNSFPDDGGYEQMQELNYELDTYNATSYALNSNDGELTLKSFAPYPFDPIPKKAESMIGKLDHILVRDWKVIEAVVDNRKIPGTNFHPSDHLPIICKFEH
jgi:endonuclease/exonuclease/phosphatase family metal-dependent hydrolase